MMKYKYFLILLLLSILITHIIYNTDSNVNTNSESFPANIGASSFKKVEPHVIEQIYMLLFMLDKIFNEHKIEYWLDGGSLLGALRHRDNNNNVVGGIIPWDDDGDVQVLEKYETKINSLKSIFATYNIQLMNVWFGFKIFFNNATPIKGYEWKYPAIDIFIMKIDNKTDKIIYKSDLANKYFSTCVHNINDIYPLHRYKFGSFELTSVSPANVKQYLTNCYGSDWEDYAYQQYDHANEQSINKIKVKLTDADKKPAYPIKLNMALIKK